MLCSFATFLAQEGLKLQSIECYLSALRHAQIANGFPDSRIGLDHPWLECVLRCIKTRVASLSLLLLSHLTSYHPGDPQANP